jgi:hypothetical protein
VQAATYIPAMDTFSSANERAIMFAAVFVYSVSASLHTKFRNKNTKRRADIVNNCLSANIFIPRYALFPEFTFDHNCDNEVVCSELKNL